ncbi:hypothetical protein, partial [Pedobacter sp. ASV28]|uniref:hypothetical protein n=1 Tax=Pedobacter sp. ASV28 TaxID=2795123 RepID=UPI0018EB5764
DFDKDAENFIYASGINNPANLNVDGLYTSEQAMYAVNYLVSGLKSIKDTGQSTSAWDRSKNVGMLHPFVGGNSSQHALNLFNPSTRILTFEIGGTGTPNHNGYGWKLGRAISDLLHNDSFQNNITVIMSLSEPTTSNDVAEISSFWDGSSITLAGLNTTFRFDNQIGIRGQAGTSQIFRSFGKNVGSAAINYQGGFSTFSFNGNNAIISGSINISVGTSLNSFRYGETSPTSSSSNSRKSMLGVLPFLTPVELMQLTKLMDGFQTLLNRKV